MSNTIQTATAEASKLVLVFTKSETQERVNSWWRIWMSGNDVFTLQESLQLTSVELAQYLAGDFAFKQD
jgi:hypothetical protein